MAAVSLQAHLKKIALRSDISCQGRATVTHFTYGMIASREGCVKWRLASPILVELFGV
jgi:hypothetical protein